MLKQKILSYAPLAGLLFLLIFSWLHLYRSPKEPGPEELSALANNFQTALADHVKKRRPEIRHITFHSARAEPGEERGRVKVSFSYSLTVEDKKADSEMLMTGTADLSKKSGGRWLLTNFQVTDSLVEFSKPLVIKAVSDTLKEEAPPSAPAVKGEEDLSFEDKTPSAPEISVPAETAPPPPDGNEPAF